MPLANISARPDERTKSSFDFSHYQDHLEIIQASNKKFGTNLTPYAIHPTVDQGDGWQQMHQQMHNDMHAQLGTSGADLTGEMDHQWYNRNYQEHLAVRSALGI